MKHHFYKRLSFIKCSRKLASGAAFALAFFAAALGATLARAAVPGEAFPAPKAYSLVMTNGYGDCYRMNLLRNRENYQAYRGICSYRGFSLSGCSTTGEVVMLRIKATPSMPEHSSIVSTSMRWGTTMYFLNDLFHPLCSWVSAGYENWYPFDMSCSVAMYINSGGYGLTGRQVYRQPDPLSYSPFSLMNYEDRGNLFANLSGRSCSPAPKAYSLVMTNGYGDCYRMNLLRNRENYQAYRGICSYRGFSLSGCSTTGEVVMLRIKGTASMPEHFSLLSTSMRWGTTQYVLNDVFRPLCSWVSAGYENWYPFDMCCSVAMYINSGGYGLKEAGPEPVTARRSTVFTTDNGTGTNLIGVLLPLTGDLADTGSSYLSALNQAFAAITSTPGMPPIRLMIEDTATDSATAYEKLVELRSNGCHIVLGPESSEECRILKIYANENDVLLISSSATATPLALPDDNLMRLTIDDSNQARALAELLAADGISDIAILSRSDIYGEGFLAALIQEFNARGGTVFATNYCPRAAELIPEFITNVAAQVERRTAVKDINKVGVVTILFDEGVQVMQSASSHAALGSVRWYGSDGMAQNNALVSDATASAFAARTRYVCSAFGRFTNALYGVVESNIIAATGNEVVPRYPMSCYDGLWLVAKALQQTGSTQTMASLIATIRSTGSSHSGCTGPIQFNACDDRAAGSYDLYEFDSLNGDGHWVELEAKIPVAPGNVAASRGAYSGLIRVVWNPVSGADSYELWGALSGNPSEAVRLAGTPATAQEVAGVAPETHCYFWVKALNSSGTSDFSEGAEGWAGSAAGPCVMINGASTDTAVLQPDAVSVTVAMNPGAHAGTEADWWLAAETPAGWYYRDASGLWQDAAGGILRPAWQGPLISLPAVEMLNISGMQTGRYVFYFGVDQRNGILDPAALWLASVELTVY
ncbi:MAG: penicillin-binding protein activator [Kiritimatiellia bacterium]